MSIDREPGFYNDPGPVAAATEQQRATVIDELRVARSACVSIMAADGRPIHWIIVLDNAPEDGWPFMAWAAARVLRDMAAVSGKPLGQCAYDVLRIAANPEIP